MIIFVCPTGCIKYVFDEATEYSVSANSISVPSEKLVIGDMNNTNVSIYTGITVPVDEYVVEKYRYINGAFELNPEWVQPVPPETYPELNPPSG